MNYKEEKEEELLKNNGSLAIAQTNRTLKDGIAILEDNIENYNKWINESKGKLDLLRSMSQPNIFDLLKDIGKYAKVTVVDKNYEVGRSDQRSTVNYKLAKIEINDGVYLDESQIESIKFIYYLKGIKKFIVTGRVF